MPGGALTGFVRRLGAGKDSTCGVPAVDEHGCERLTDADGRRGLVGAKHIDCHARHVIGEWPDVVERFDCPEGRVTTNR